MEDEPLYKDRDEWKDIAPVEQDDGAQPVCPVVYTERFVDAMNYFRAVVSFRLFSGALNTPMSGSNSFAHPKNKTATHKTTTTKKILPDFFFFFFFER